MNRILFLLVLLIIIISNCSTNIDEEKKPSKYVSDRTPFIAGLIEFSHDTTHHYPEVVVGYVTDVRNKKSPDYLLKYPEIYNTTLQTQVLKTSYAFGLNFKAEKNAKVRVMGPLEKKEDQIITFSHESKGVYGDKNYDLARIPNGQYELVVELPDGRVYSSKTHIPEAVNFTIPDSIGLNVKYKPYDDGTPREEDTEGFSIIYPIPSNSFLTEIQNNSDKDRDLLLLKPDEKFKFLEKGPYLRTGAAYGVALLNVPRDTLFRSWIQRLDKPKKEIWMKRKNWIRISHYSEGIGGNFFPLVDKFATEDHFSTKIEERRLNAADQNDSTYLFDISTIRKLSKSGNLLPNDSTDAIGFFGGYFSHYKKTTVYPIRDFDLDTVFKEN